MQPQYDYQELIDELKDEVSAGSLADGEIIQILRADEPEKDGYKPIIDWHYSKETMAQELAPDKNDTKEEVKDKLIIREQYLKDKPNLEDISVETCLAEMFEKTPKKPKSRSKKNPNPFF